MILAVALIVVLGAIAGGAMLMQRRATGSKEPRGEIAVFAALGMVMAIGMMLALWWRQ